MGDRSDRSVLKAQRPELHRLRLLWAGALVLIPLGWLSMVALWSAPSTASGPPPMVARTDALLNCKAALTDSGRLLTTYDVTALNRPEQGEVIVTGQALFRTEQDRMVARRYRCGYNVARAAVVRLELGPDR